MIKIAKDAGAGLVKFQLFNAEDDKGKPHYQWVKAHELTFDQAKLLFDYGECIGMEVFFSVFGVKYVDWCEKIGVKRYKIAAGNKDQTINQAVNRTWKPVIRSQTCHTVTYPSDGQRLFTVSCYPTESYHLGLGQVSFKRFDGFSDHTIGSDAAKIALARGARIIECHFCIEHNREFPDNDWSKTPAEIKELVRWEKVCQDAL